MNLNIKLTTRSGRDVIVNWANVNYAVTASNPYESNNEYVEIHCGKQQVDVKESLQDITNLMNRSDPNLLFHINGEQIFNTPKLK